MTADERRASGSLAGIFAIRMLGLFLVLPVFALEARHYEGGDDPALVGLAMGLYGLTQGLLQIPFGMASDRFGRKRVIAAGLVVFALGSFVAALADSMAGLMAGRALQGAGAVSAAVTALLADQTRDTVRTKAMAVVGASIGLMFAVSLIGGPMIAGAFGLAGVFVVTGGLGLLGVAVLYGLVPAETRVTTAARGRLADVLRHGPSMRLNFGVFVLHALLLAMWVGVPALLVRAELPAAQHWWVYLPTVGASFFVMAGLLFPLERRGYLRAVFLCAVGLVGLVQVALALVAGRPDGGGLLLLCALLFFFFCGSNILEATQPSMASRLAPAHSRGTAMGVYNTLQSLGFFAGGAAGGWLSKVFGLPGLFWACAAAIGIWLMVAWPMRAPRSQPSAEQVLAEDARAT